MEYYEISIAHTNLGARLSKIWMKARRYIKLQTATSAATRQHSRAQMREIHALSSQLDLAAAEINDACEGMTQTAEVTAYKEDLNKLCAELDDCLMENAGPWHCTEHGMAHAALRTSLLEIADATQAANAAITTIMQALRTQDALHKKAQTAVNALRNLRLGNPTQPEPADGTDAAGE